MTVNLAPLNRKISRMIDILRRDSISPDNYTFLVYLTFLQQEGVLSHLPQLPQAEVDGGLNESIREYCKTSRVGDECLELAQHFSFPHFEITDSSLHAIICELVSIQDLKLGLSFAEIFDQVLLHVLEAQRYYTGESYFPSEVANLMTGIIELPINAKIYNPFSGFASIAVAFPGRPHILCQAAIMIEWALGSLRQFAHGRFGSTNILRDPIQHWNPSNESYDLVVAAVPLGMRIQNTNTFNQSYEHFVVENGLKSISESGKIVIAVSQGFLFREGREGQFRRRLIDQDLIETVIDLPGGLLPYSSIPLAILVINKAKNAKGKIRAVDAKKYIISVSGNKKKLDTDALLECLNNNQEIDTVRWIDKKVIVDQQYNLAVRRYFLPSDIYGVPLSQIATHLQGVRVRDESQAKQVRIKDLKSDLTNYRLDIDRVIEPQFAPRRPDLRLIKESCILVATQWNELKPTYFKYEHTPILISQDIVALKLRGSDEDEIQLVVSELLSPGVQKQVDYLKLGSSIPRIRIADLMSVKIDFPDSTLELQARIKGISEARQNALLKEKGLEKKLKELKDEATREFQSIRHSCRQYLSAFKSNVSGTRKFIKNSETPISLDTPYSIILNQSFGEHLDKLEGLIESMSRMLMDPDNVPSSAAKNINLIELLTRAQHISAQPHFEFVEMRVDKTFSRNDENRVEPIVNISEDDFFNLFMNVVSNAKHGFKDPSRQNLIAVELSFDQINEQCMIAISNNGDPIPEAFTLKHLTTRGEKTIGSNGQGLGGSDIKRIADKYNGSFKLENFPEEEFPVRYQFQFPLVKL